MVIIVIIKALQRTATFYKQFFEIFKDLRAVETHLKHGLLPVTPTS